MVHRDVSGLEFGHGELLSATTERAAIQEWFIGEVNLGTVAVEAVESIRGTRIPYRASGVPYRFTQ